MQWAKLFFHRYFNMATFKATSDPNTVVKDGTTWIPRGSAQWQEVEIFLANDGVLEPAEPSPPTPPVEVDMRRGRLALLQVGLLDAVESAIAAMSGDEGKAAQINWEYATALRRNDSLVTAITGGLGLSETEVDDLFALALSLPA